MSFQFSNFVESLTNHLAKLWKDDQRVAVVKLVISGRLKNYLRNVYPYRSVKLTQWALHSKNLLR